MTRRLRTSCVALAVSLLLSSSSAFALGTEVPDGPTHGPARELWIEAQQLFQSGDYVAAADRFDRAYELERAPLLGLWVARSLMRAGRWVDALDRYRDIAEQPLPSDATSRDWSARRDAKSERQQLLPRVPNVTVLLEGAPSSEVIVELNGALLPAEFIGIARPVDPGEVHVRAEHGRRVAEQTLQIAEGESKTVHLSFALPTPPNEPAPRRPPSAAAGGSRSSELQRVVSFVAVGVGGAALLTGGVFATLAAGDEGRLLRDCPQSRCPARLRSTIDTYESKKTVATVALWSGAALVGSGVVLYLTLPRHSVRASSVGAFVAGNQAGLWGSF